MFFSIYKKLYSLSTRITEEVGFDVNYTKKKCNLKIFILFYIFFQIMTIFTGGAILNVIGIFVAIFAVTYTYFQWTFQTWKRKKVPYVKPKFPYGNLQSPSKPISISEDVYNIVKKAEEQG